MRGVVVITGASAGVGRASARAFARKGYAVGLIARGLERLESARGEIRSMGARALAVAADVADEKQVEKAAERIERDLGPVDVWVNNAMATIFAPVEKITPEEFIRATDVTYLGAVWGTLAALRRMRRRNRGVIVQVGSALAYRPIPLQSPYCGAKHALRGFTDSVRTELIHEKSAVHLTMVQLPAINTPQFDWGRSRMAKRPRPVAPIFQPEVAAEAIVWAAEHRRREIFVGWPSVKAILGTKIAAGVADRKAADRAWGGQLTHESDRGDRPDNLFEPAPGEQEAHGRFNHRAKSFSLQLWATTHIGWIVAGVAALAAPLLAAVFHRKRAACVS